MSIFALLLAVVHVPGVTGITLLSGWNFLSVTLPFLVLPRLTMTLGHWFGVIFLLYATASLWWTPWPLDGMQALWHWLLLGGSFCVGRRLRNLRGIFAGLGVGIGVSAILGLFQLAGLSPIITGVDETWPAVAGLFLNPNVLSETAAVVLVGLVVYRLWWLVPTAALAVLLGEGRGALVALGVTLAAHLVAPRHRIDALIGAAIILVAVFLIKNGTDSAAIRVAAVAAASHGLPLLGHGVGSFTIQTAAALFEHLHNDALEVIYEFGIGSIALFAVVGSALVRQNHAKPVLFCILAISMFSFPLFMPVTGFVAAVVAGYLHRSRALAWHHGAIGRPRLYERLAIWKHGRNRDGGNPVPL